jgi:hypothetical protein
VLDGIGEGIGGGGGLIIKREGAGEVVVGNEVSWIELDLLAQELGGLGVVAVGNRLEGALLKVVGLLLGDLTLRAGRVCRKRVGRCWRT